VTPYALAPFTKFPGTRRYGKSKSLFQNGESRNNYLVIYVGAAVTRLRRKRNILSPPLRQITQ